MVEWSSFDSPIHARAPWGPFWGALEFFFLIYIYIYIKNQLKSLKIATLVVREYSKSTQNEKLTLDKSSKYDLDSKNAIL